MGSGYKLKVAVDALKVNNVKIILDSVPMKKLRDVSCIIVVNVRFLNCNKSTTRKRLHEMNFFKNFHIYNVRKKVSK